MDRTVICDGGEEASIVPVYYPRGTISVSSLGYFLPVDSSSKPSHPSFPLFIGARHIQEYFKKKRRRKQRLLNQHQDKSRNEERIKLSNVIV